jgi:tRNA threonylcarbamoyl adenosine modification protein YeaZ
VKTPITLGITTAGTVAAAIVADEIECAGATASQALDGTMACVLKLLAAADVGLDDVKLIAVCRGPGSFTGLRIGVAFAKSVAQARGLPIVGVSSYDVAEFDSKPLRFPCAAVVQGKRAFYYVRIRDAPEGAPRFARGTKEELGPIMGGIDEADTRHLADVPASEQAVRVARLGRRFAADGAVADWRHVEIDYGQRPNAVINWEARGGPPERGGAASAAKLG